MMKRTTENQGFSLLEVMIALAIFSIGIVALYGIQTMTVTQNYTSNRITTASTWATGKIEDLMSLKYSDLEDTNNDGAAGLEKNTSATADGSEPSPDGVYTILWNVAETDNLAKPNQGYPLPNTKTVRVIVLTQRKGTGSTVELEYVKRKS